MKFPAKIGDHELAPALEIRHARVSDAADIWLLVKHCDVLELNSCYAYLLICRDFAATSLVATSQGNFLGFVSAYIPPSRPDVVFVWQIGIASAARSRGVAKSLLRALLRAPACRRVGFLEATVTPSNAPSTRLFRSLGEQLRTNVSVLPGFQSSDFGPPRDECPPHEPEEVIRIGPIGDR